MRIGPQRDAVLAPPATEGPARQRFARVPFPLPAVEQAPRREAIAPPAQQNVAARLLVLSQRGRVPFRKVALVDPDKRRLAPHGQTYVVSLEVAVDGLAEPIDSLPLVVRVRP